MTESDQETSAAPVRKPELRATAASDRVSDYFVACPRCSYFLAGYKLIQGDFEQAAQDSNGDWLDLTWNLAVRNLVQKSFGHELDEDLQALQGICPMCGRAFIYEAGSGEGEADRFRVQINPRN